VSFTNLLDGEVAFDSCKEVSVTSEVHVLTTSIFDMHIWKVIWK
jgi:hypothetical protein